MKGLTMDIKDTLKERGERYGEFKDHAEITQALKQAMTLGGAKWVALSDDKKEALEMIVHKIGRIIDGDPEYLDCWVDIAGYATMATESLKAPE